jgi:hypothetical protein
MTHINKEYRVSFCTTCHNRAEQLKRTFDENVRTVLKSVHNEWVILNYCSDDDVHEFMVERLPRLTPQIVYVRMVNIMPWHLSVAKNIAHRFGRGHVLANLDCDNFIREAADIITRHYSHGCRLMHLWSGVYRDGTCGRIAMDRSLFYALGGYDEELYPMGFQDRDIILRAVAMGVRYYRFPCSAGSAIQNTKEDSVRNCGPNARWEHFEQENRALSRRNIEAGRLKTRSSATWWALALPIVYGGTT